MQAIRVRGLMLHKQLLKEGKLVADGTEQTLIEALGLLNLEGYVDLSPMQDGDTVILRRYVKITANDDYKLHGEETYIGVQAQPLIRFPPLAGYYGIKVTLQQTTGTYKSFPYQFFKEI
ncbi:MAG: hypothetical protein QXV23_06580 [Candidatus Bathyarchaeia archaeon]